MAPLQTLLTPGGEAIIAPTVAEGFVAAPIPSQPFSLAEAIESNPRFVQAYLKLGNLYLDNDYDKEAAQVFQNAILANDSDGEAHQGLAEGIIVIDDEQVWGRRSRRSHCNSRGWKRQRTHPSQPRHYTRHADKYAVTAPHQLSPQHGL